MLYKSDMLIHFNFRFQNLILKFSLNIYVKINFEKFIELTIR